MKAGDGKKNEKRKAKKITDFRRGYLYAICRFSTELQARLLYNTVMLSEKNPGELIKNYNRPDNPLVDVLDQGSRFAEAMEKFARVPGIGRICRIAKSKQQKENELTSAVSQAVNAVQDEENG